MFRFSIVIFASALSAGAMAGGLPSDTVVTSENANEYSISLQDLGSGDPKTLLYQLQFSKKLGSCVAGRVQTTLYAGSHELSSSSMDYPVKTSSPSLLVHFPEKEHDMAVTIQYCCTSGVVPGCKKSLSINSLKGFLGGAKGS